MFSIAASDRGEQRNSTLIPVNMRRKNPYVCEILREFCQLLGNPTVGSADTEIAFAFYIK